MSKKKWRRVRLPDLATAEEQQKLLGVMDHAKGQPAPDSSEKQGHETATTGR